MAKLIKFFERLNPISETTWISKNESYKGYQFIIRFTIFKKKVDLDEIQNRLKSQD